MNKLVIRTIRSTRVWVIQTQAPWNKKIWQDLSEHKSFCAALRNQKQSLSLEYYPEKEVRIICRDTQEQIWKAKKS